MTKNIWKYYGVALGAALLDQALKLWVYFNMQMGVTGHIKLLDNWFKLFYTLNPGMAFGIQLGFRYDKILLTVIRMVATILIIRYIWQLTKEENNNTWLVWGWTLILGGAAGNGIDSIFYGKLLQNVPYGAPMSWFYGQVIDMLYIDIWSGKLPNWIPLFGGNFVTCLPVFNLADVAILGGIFLIILVQNKKYQESKHSLQNNESVELETKNSALLDQLENGSRIEF